jgi:hypothetical protein
MPFLNPVRLEILEDSGDRPLYKVIEPFTYFCPETKKTYEVGKDYITDGASVPRLALAWLIAGGKGLRAGVLHDWLYDHGMRLKQVKNKAEADDVFWWALLDSGHSKDLADGMWDAVHVFGDDYFNADT